MREKHAAGDNQRFMTDITPQADLSTTVDETPVAAVPEAPPQRFDVLPLDAKLLRAVTESGYTAMTPIQAKAIPLVLAGRDVMGAAQTDRKSTRLNSSHVLRSRMPSSA